MSLFAGLKEKFADKLAEFKGTATPADPADKHALELVEAATSDELIAPDWSLNFNVIDFVNSDVSHNTGRTLKAMKRSLAKPNTKVQLLSLTLLEGCVKNCPSEFHVHLATSELWADVVKLAEDTSITRVDAEVRDKVLGMVEDFSKLQTPQFQAAYESLLDRGVDFPVRAENEAVPLVMPPSAGAAAAAGLPPAANAAAGDGLAVAAAGAPAPAPGAEAAPAADPLAGLDEQDRAAIQVALAELEAEAQAAQEAARVAAEADAEERRQLREQQQQQQQQAKLLLAQQQQQVQQQQQAAMEAEAALGLLAAAQTAEAAAAAQAATGTASATATAAAADGGALGVAVPAAHQQAPPPEQQQQQAEAEGEGEGPEEGEPVEQRVARLLETASNTTLLLSEMLASVPDSEPLAVREPYVAEVADACVRLRSRLERHLATLSDEAMLASALSQHEELSRVLLRYDELLAAAESVAPTVPRNAAAVAMSHAAASRGAAGAGAGGQPYPPTEMLQRQTLQHPGQHGQPHGQAAGAAGTETAGQKVAAVAAALKERFTGAFDKLMAAAAAARAPGGAPPSQGGAAPAAATAWPGAVGGGSGGGASPTGATAAAAAGAFTLLDDEDEEDANEGTSLIAKRTAAPQPPRAPLPQGLEQQMQMQQLLHAATAAPPPPPPAPPAAAAAGSDLINFDEEAPPQAPAAASAAPPAAPVPAPAPPPPQAPASGAPFVAVEDTQSGTGNLLAGLTVHTPADNAGATAPGAASSRGPSAGGADPDHLVEALDRLVSQSSANASTVAAEAVAAAAGETGAAAEQSEGAAAPPPL